MGNLLRALSARRHGCCVLPTDAFGDMHRRSTTGRGMNTSARSAAGTRRPCDDEAATCAAPCKVRT